MWHSRGGPREVTIWCSNDYLGMSQNPVVVQAMVDTARRLGIDFDPLRGHRTVRLSFAGSTSDVTEAMDRLVSAAKLVG